MVGRDRECLTRALRSTLRAMDSREPGEARIRPLQRLLGRMAHEATGSRVPRLLLDPERAWSGRVSLDRARVRSRPDDADAWWRLGMGLHALGRHEVASAAFVRALRHDLSSSVPRGRRLPLFVASHRSELELLVDVAVALSTSQLAHAWIGVEPLAFDVLREALGPRGGNAYRIDPAHLEVLSRQPRAAESLVVLSPSFEGFLPFPRTVPRVRVPRRWVEAPESAERYDAVLCPTRHFADGWGQGPSTQHRRLAVAWPGPARTRDGHEAGPGTELTLAFDAPVGDPAAWSSESWTALVRALLTELPEARLVLRAGGARQLELRRVWQRIASSSSHDQRRVRLESGSSAVDPLAVIVEPTADSVARALRNAERAAVLVFAPCGSTSPVGELPAYDRPLRLVAAVHELLRAPEAFAAARQRARASIFFDEDSDACDVESAVREICALDVTTGS